MDESLIKDSYSDSKDITISVLQCVISTTSNSITFYSFHLASTPISTFWLSVIKYHTILSPIWSTFLKCLIDYFQRLFIIVSPTTWNCNIWKNTQSLEIPTAPWILEVLNKNSVSVSDSPNYNSSASSCSPFFLIKNKCWILSRF